MDEFIKIVFGEYSGYEYLAVEFLALVGFSLMSFWNFIYRTNQSSEPSFRTWFRDKNYKNTFFIISLILTMYLGLRFKIDLIGKVYSYIGIESAGVSDKWFVFPLVGVFYRSIIHKLNKFKNKLLTK